MDRNNISIIPNGWGLASCQAFLNRIYRGKANGAANRFKKNAWNTTSKLKRAFSYGHKLVFECKGFFLFLQKEVEEAEISGNLDAPEGGFDAVLQALTCNVSVTLKCILLLVCSY